MIVDGIEMIRVALKQLDESITKMQQQIEIIKIDRVWRRIKKLSYFMEYLKWSISFSREMSKIE